MAAIVPHRFLIRLCHPCRYVKEMPSLEAKEHLLELPEDAILHNFSQLDEVKNFADVRLAWNELGLGLECTVTGKEQPPQGDSDRPRTSDGISVWIDTRDARAGHRASRYCHQFHCLAAGAGPDKEEPVVVQSKINRALQDAPLSSPAEIPIQLQRTRGGYRLEVFLPAAVLNGYDPEQHPRLGFYYSIRDQELGDQYLSLTADFPFSDDPSLWSVLELKK